MNHKIRLGPIAIFLVVVAIVLTTLSTLTLATTNADKVMAERFAAVTQIRYDLEAEGQKFIRDYDTQAAAGNIDAAAINANATENGYSTAIEKDGYTLEIEVTAPDADGSYDITKWQLTKEWNADDPYQHIWKGAEQ